MHCRSAGGTQVLHSGTGEMEFIMKRLWSITATLAVLTLATPNLASAQYDTTSTNRTYDDNTTTGTMQTTDDTSMPSTAGPLPFIALLGALLMAGGIYTGLRRSKQA